MVDIHAADLTATQTSRAFAAPLRPAFQVAVQVTAASGTNETLDVHVESSDDKGVTWTRIYSFPRITAAGTYRSHTIPLRGSLIRYVQTVGGTDTPTFTRSVTRDVVSDAEVLVTQITDRALTVNTLNSVTSTLPGFDARSAVLSVTMGAITTTAPQFMIEGSEDNSNWVALTAALTSVASSTVTIKVNDTQFPFLRAKVTTAGSGATLGSVTLKAVS